MKNAPIRIGIIGGAGYTGGELLRILLHHPQADIVFIHSKSNAGNPVASVHRDLAGDTDLRFSADYQTDVDVWILCVGHGEARQLLDSVVLPDELRIIDLSQDFRLENQSQHGDRRFVYGLPELNRAAISEARNIANPGCFATAVVAAAPGAGRRFTNRARHRHYRRYGRGPESATQPAFRLARQQHFRL